MSSIQRVELKIERRENRGEAVDVRVSLLGVTGGTYGTVLPVNTHTLWWLNR